LDLYGVFEANLEAQDGVERETTSLRC
jgi:hypothetical protein